jgi:hypothetical protein
MDLKSMEQHCEDLAQEFEFDYHDPEGLYVNEEYLKEYSKEELKRIEKFLKLPKSQQAMQYLYGHLIADFEEKDAEIKRLRDILKI